jgi:hypothetical protein
VLSVFLLGSIVLNESHAARLSELALAFAILELQCHAADLREWTA